MPSPILAPRGTYDLLPPASTLRAALEAQMRAVATSFGYGEIRTPIFEATELFERGVGEGTDIVEKEMYTFVDKGERRMTLRPEFTAPVVRAALEHKLFAAGPQRFFYLGPIFRYERPQKGRYRQPHQFGVECYGYAEPEADVEVISLARQLVASHGINDARLQLNSIGDAACRERYREALLAFLRPLAASLSEDSQRRLERNPLRVLDSKDPRDGEAVRNAPRMLEHLCDPCNEHFGAVRALLDTLAIPYDVNPHIVRGLDYYTRTVFEIVSNSLGAQSTVCGGGRYDNLVASLGGPDVPAVGFAMGIERFEMILSAAGSAPETTRRGVQAIALGVQARARLLLLAQRLRERGTAVFMDFADRKLPAQFKLAERNGARAGLILGSDELEKGELVVRDLVERSDIRLALDDIEGIAIALQRMGV
ncbi:MAG: histidine--tRNA ligase [Candidatus Baltobacteraceae bacterium]